MKFFSILIIILSALEGCSQKPKLEITTEYVLNKYWDKPFSNFFIVEKMKVKKDSTLDIFQPGFKPTANGSNVTEKLEIHMISIESLVTESILENRIREIGMLQTLDQIA
jgi:hypothetical protein